MAKSEFYLDKLLEIYPPEEISREKQVERESPILKRLFQEKNCKKLLRELIRLKKIGFKFPIENPYISFLSYYEDAIDKNPETIKKICEKLFEMSYDELKDRLEAPKKASRRTGPMFKLWLRSKFNFIDVNEFRRAKGIVFLNGGDKFLKEYAKSELKCKFKELSKGLDFIARVKNKYIIGTAKFITDIGGSQSNQFIEALSLIKETKCSENIIKIAIIDGAPWLNEKEKNEFCFSALNYPL
ncbi:MAG: hypothetical protein ABIL13_07010 [candidate division WOR-3 bacterium]